MDPRDREPLPPDEETSVTRRMPRAEEEYGYVEEPVVEEEIVEEPPRRPPALWPWLLALLVLVLAGLAALWYFTQEDDPETKPVPSVVRLAEGDAVQRLDDEGFESQIQRGRSDEAEQGIVFEQRPGAGAELEEGSTVVIVVSEGPATVEVPNVTGLPADRAQDLLQDAGFQVNRAQVFSEEEPGTVVAQNPAAGERAPRESDVRINVSKGTNTVQVPDVVGRTAAEAGAILREAGLSTPNVVVVPSARPENEVVAQNPPAGSEAQRGSTVRINVSNGQGGGGGGGGGGGTTTAPEATELPDVVGQPEQDAVQALEDAGASVEVVDEPVDDPAEDGIVLRQDPEGGATIEPGDGVEIVVGRFS